METATFIITNIITLFTAVGGTSLFFLKISKREKTASAMLSEIEAMKQKLDFYDKLFEDMKGKLEYYIVEYHRIRDIILKKCPKCKELEV